MSKLAEAMEKYVIIGEKLGLRGPELKTFMETQQALDKDLFNEERDNRVRVRQKEQQDQEHALNLAYLAHELEMRKLEVKTSTDDDNDENASHAS